MNTTTTPAAANLEPTPTACGRKFINEARANLTWRPFFQELSPGDQEARVLELARHVCLSRSRIGKLAAAISERYGDLQDAIGEFLAAFPESADTVAAAREALTAAGLRHEFIGELYSYYGANHYFHAHRFVDGLEAVLNSMGHSIDDLDPPNLEVVRAEAKGGAS